MRIPLAAIAGLMIPLSVGAAEPAGRFGWFANVVGSCWIGTFPDGSTQHAHCYTSQFDHFIRGTATLSNDRDGTRIEQFHGDSVFAWKENERRIEYYIWGSDGNHGRHEAYYAGEELVFPVRSRLNPERVVASRTDDPVSKGAAGAMSEVAMHRSRLAGFIIDCRTDDLKAAAAFWGSALGMEVRPLPGEEDQYIELADPDSRLHIEVQSVDHPSRVHLDIESDDVEAEVQRLEALGARRVGKIRTWWVMEAPTGQRFCIVRAKSPDFEGNSNQW